VSSKLPCDPVEQQKRQDELDELYAADGRHDNSHPMHALYTGLFVQNNTIIKNSGV
jgi:hypothetical protein